MKLFKLMAITVLGLAVAGCASVETVTRNAPLETSSFGGSESNSFYPNADVVWRGDPIGNRIEQIAAMFKTALDRNVDKMDGLVPVVVDYRLIRFHGVTERTRYSVGGVYNIEFEMTVRHALTGEILEPTRRIEADLSAPGGIAALMQDQRGQTEKVRVTDFLTQVFADELSGTYEI